MHAYSVVQPDAPPTGDQNFAESSPPDPATNFRGDYTHVKYISHTTYFYGRFPPSADSRRAVISF